MAAPSFHQLPDEDTPSIRPDYLRQAEGGGEGGGQPAGNAPAASNNGQNGPNLAAQEQNAAAGAAAAKTAGAKADEKSESADESADKKPSRFKRFMNNRTVRNVGIGTIAAGGIFGGGFGLVTLSTGPGAIMQWGEDLKSIMNGPVRHLTGNRSGRRLLYALAGQTERGRLGRIGNFLADRYERRLNDAGLKSIYDKLTGRLVGYEILDEGKAADFSRDMPDLKTTPSEGLVDSSGKSVSEGGHRIISMRDDNFKTRRLITKLAVKNIGMSKAGYYIGQRLLSIRGGVKFHVLNPLTRKKDELWEKFRQRVEDGDAKAINEGTGGTPLEGGTAEADSKDARSKFVEIKGQLQEIIKTARTPLLVIGAICGLKAFSHMIDSQDLSNMQVAARMGMESVNLASQVQSGQGFTSDQLGVYADRLYDPKTKTAVVDDPGVQQAMGEKMTGFDYVKDIKPTANNSKPWFFSVVDAIPTDMKDFMPSSAVVAAMAGSSMPSTDLCTILGNVTKFVTNIIVIKQIMGAFSFVINKAVQGVTFVLFGHAKTIEQLVQAGVDYFATHAPDTNARGAAKGGTDNIGVHWAANDQMRAMGGRDLSDSEATQVQQTVMAEQKQEFASASFYDRYLNVSEPGSAMGSIVLAWPRSKSQFFAFMQNLPIKMASMLSQSLGLGKAFAADNNQTYDYGFPLIGFSEDELNDPAYANPFANEKAILDSGHLQQLNQQYGVPCFNMTVDDDGTLHTGESDDPTKRPADCDDKTNKELTRYRFYLADLVTGNEDACYEGMEDACAQVGMGTTPAQSNSAPSSPTGTVSDPFAPSDTMTCPVGTDGGVQQGYHEGLPIKIRICDVQNIQVNARIANNVNSLLNDAAAQGIKMSGSGFVTMDGQIAKRKANHCPDIYLSPASACHPPTAIPGFSNHQMGEAIDFTQNGSTILSGSSPFNWLTANASKYGLKNLPSEPWHWSVDGN